MPNHHYFLLIALVLGTISGCGNAAFDDGLVKHSVTGQVLVNGVPEKGIVVTFLHTDPTVTENAARPVAVTEDEGRFSLSTNGDKDGAVVGKYNVSFSWPHPTSGEGDFFKGKYVKAGGSDFEVVIDGKDTEVPPFQLEAPKTAVDAAHQAATAKTRLN